MSATEIQNLRDIRTQELRREIARGIEQLDQGEKARLEMDKIKQKAREIREPLRAVG